MMSERMILSKYIVQKPWNDHEVCSENPRFDGECGEIGRWFVEIETSSYERRPANEVGGW
jgi:hypothetical protein